MRNYLCSFSFSKYNGGVYTCGAFLLRDPDNLIGSDPRNEFDCIQAIMTEFSTGDLPFPILKLAKAYTESNVIWLLNSVACISDDHADFIEDHTFYTETVTEEMIPEFESEYL